MQYYVSLLPLGVAPVFAKRPSTLGMHSDAWGLHAHYESSYPFFLIRAFEELPCYAPLFEETLLCCIGKDVPDTVWEFMIETLPARICARKGRLPSSVHARSQVAQIKSAMEAEKISFQAMPPPGFLACMMRLLALLFLTILLLQ